MISSKSHKAFGRSQYLVLVNFLLVPGKHLMIKKTGVCWSAIATKEKILINKKEIVFDIRFLLLHYRSFIILLNLIFATVSR